jgi:hypothetical protein
VGYVLAVARSHHVIANPGAGPQRVEQLAAALPSRPGTAAAPVTAPKDPASTTGPESRSHHPDEVDGHHTVLVRRNRSDGELAFYRCWSPTPGRTVHLGPGSRNRWSIETCFQTGNNAVGLEQHQVRRWDSWYRYTTLVMLAHALLTVIAARERTCTPTDPQLIPLTINEISPPETAREYESSAAGTDTQSGAWPAVGLLLRPQRRENLGQHGRWPSAPPCCPPPRRPSPAAPRAQVRAAEQEAPHGGTLIVNRAHLPHALREYEVFYNEHRAPPRAPRRRTPYADSPSRSPNGAGSTDSTSDDATDSAASCTNTDMRLSWPDDIFGE